MPKTPRPNVLLMDGSHLLHRMLYSKRGVLRTRDKTLTGGVLGFVDAMQWYLNHYAPVKACVVCWDKSPYSYRLKLYPEYKANRKPENQPDPVKRQEALDHNRAFEDQYQRLKRVLTLMGINRVRIPGFEADDLLWKIPRMELFGPNTQYVVCSADRDLIQVVDENISYDRLHFDTRTWDPLHELTTAKNFVQLHKMTPHNFVLAKALKAGDDNVKGVPGFGPKTVLDLFHGLGDLQENALRHQAGNNRLSRVRGLCSAGNWAVFERNLKLMDLSKVPYPQAALNRIRLQLNRPVKFDPDLLYQLFYEYEFMKLLSRWSVWKQPFVRLHKG